MSYLVTQLTDKKPEKEQKEQSRKTAKNHDGNRHLKRMVSAEVHLDLPLAEKKEEYCQGEHCPGGTS